VSRGAHLIDPRPPRRWVALLATAAALTSCSGGAVELDAEPPQGAAAEACADLLEALPDQVADQPAREVEPDTAPGAAWGDPPIVLTCTDEPPAGFGRTSTCTTANGVDWYLPEEQVTVEEVGKVTMTTVHREAFVRVELPPEHWPPATTMVDLAEAISENLEATGRCR
jgi:hypothetical protein